MKRGSSNPWAMIYVERAMLDNFIEFNELDREVWEFLDIPSRGDKLKLWSEPDARC